MVTLHGTNHGKRPWLVTMAAAVFAVLVAVSVFPGSEASSVGGTSVGIYDQDSEDYGDLVYLSDRLPRSLEPAEWCRSDQGMWYNIVSGASCGKILTYGATEGMAPSSIRDDIRAYLGIGSAEDFAVMQVSFSSSHGAVANLNIEKDGEPLKIDGKDRVTVSVGGTGVPLSSSMQHACLFSMGTPGSGCDIQLASLSGTYAVSLVSGGSSGSAQTFFSRDSVSVSGIVRDADGGVLENASVAYSYSWGRTDSGTVKTSSDGRYSIQVPRGSTVVLQSISCDGYTFGDIPQPGTVISDTVLPAINAAERTLEVTVTDASGRPAENIGLTALWLIQNDSDTPSKYDKSYTADNCAVVSDTNASGKLRITFTVPDGDTVYLYLRAVSNGTYTFQTNDGDSGILAGLPETAGDPFPTSLLDGNVCWSPSSSEAVVLKAVEESIAVSVKAKNGSDGVPLADVLVAASWYYQVDNGNSTYRIVKDPESISGSITPGKASVLGPAGDDGKTVVVYKSPSAFSGCTAYLCVSYSGTVAGSPRDAYSFAIADIAVSDASQFQITDLFSGKNGCAAQSGAISDVTLMSEDTAYICSGTLTGTIPSGTSAQILYGASSSTKADAIVPLADGTFKFYVKAGTVAVIMWTDVSGYSFTNNHFTTASATSDFAYSSIVTKRPSSFERDVPSEIRTCNISSLPADAEVTVAYSVSGHNYRVSLLCDGGVVMFRILGWEDDTVDSLAVYSNGTYMSVSEDAYTAHAIVQASFVTFASQGGAPAADNVVPNVSVSVYCDGVLYGRINTGSDGRASLNLPLSADLQYRYGQYSVTDRVAAASNPFDGSHGINLYGLIAVETTANITVRYVAVSSLGNIQSPTVVDLFQSQTKAVKTGTDVSFEAPTMSGFTFSGWILDGTVVSSSSSCTIPVTADMDGKTVVAAYSSNPAPEGGIDPNALVLGFVAVMVAILSLAYVLINIRRP